MSQPRRRVRIKVTAKHIKAGVRNSALACPIALAVKDTLGWEAPAVSFSVIFRRDALLGRPQERAIKTTAKMKSFITKFDLGKPVSPEVFYALFD